MAGFGVFTGSRHSRDVNGLRTMRTPDEGLSGITRDGQADYILYSRKNRIYRFYLGN